jgi:hypothetical protein
MIGLQICGADSDHSDIRGFAYDGFDIKDPTIHYCLHIRGYLDLSVPYDKDLPMYLSTV